MVDRTLTPGTTPTVSSKESIYRAALEKIIGLRGPGGDIALAALYGEGAQQAQSNEWGGVETLLQQRNDALAEVERLRDSSETCDQLNAARYRYLRTHLGDGFAVMVAARGYLAGATHLDEEIDRLLATANTQKAREPQPNDAVRWICGECSTVNSNDDLHCCVKSCKGCRPFGWPNTVSEGCDGA